MIDSILVAIIGIVGGLIAGFLGTTTSITSLFGLTFFKLIPSYQTAAGTVLVSILPPLSAFSAYIYWKRGQVNLYYALILIVFCAVFELVGAKLNNKWNKKTLEILLSIYLLGLAIYFFTKSEDK